MSSPVWINLKHQIVFECEVVCSEDEGDNSLASTRLPESICEIRFLLVLTSVQSELLY